MDPRDDKEVAFVTLYARIINELARDPRLAQEGLARRLNVTMRTVQRYLTDLEREGYILVHRDRKPFTYEIAWDRSLPYFGQLRLRTFHPEMIERVSGLQGATADRR
jgi:predicted transcriptional regulator